MKLNFGVEQHNSACLPTHAKYGHGGGVDIEDATLAFFGGVFASQDKILFCLCIPFPPSRFSLSFPFPSLSFPVFFFPFFPSPFGVVSQLFCQHLVDVLDQLVTANQRFIVYAAISTVLEPETAILTSTWRTCYSDAT